MHHGGGGSVLFGTLPSETTDLQILAPISTETARRFSVDVRSKGTGTPCPFFGTRTLVCGLGPYDSQACPKASKSKRIATKMIPKTRRKLAC